MPSIDYEKLLNPEVVEVDCILHYANNLRDKLIKSSKVHGEAGANADSLHDYWMCMIAEMHEFKGVLELLCDLGVINDDQVADIYIIAESKANDAFFEAYNYSKKSKNGGD